MSASFLERMQFPAAPDEEFDKMAALTRRVVGVPVAAVSLVDDACHLLPGAAGLAGVFEETRNVPLTHSFCKHVVASAEPFVVVDAHAEALLADNPVVAEAGLVAYAGMPLYDDTGQTIGSLCVFDTEVREWTGDELETLADLAAACSKQLQLREATVRAAVDADRIRIADSLHRTVVKDLFGLSMTLGGARSRLRGPDDPGDAELGRAIDDLDAILKNVRDAVYEPIA